MTLPNPDPSKLKLGPSSSEGVSLWDDAPEFSEQVTSISCLNAIDEVIDESALEQDDFVPLSYVVAHSVTGRIRLKIERLKREPQKIGRCLMALINTPGVLSISTNNWNGSVVIEYDDSRLDQFDVLKCVRNLNPDSLAEVQPIESKSEAKSAVVAKILKRALNWLDKIMPGVVQLALGGAAFAAAALKMPVFVTRLLVAASVAPVASRALHTLVDERKFGVDALDGVAATVMMLNGKYVEAAFMTALISTGEFIREQTSRKCQKLVADLLGLSGRFAWLVKGKKRICIPADEVKVGDIVVVYPGDMVPVDGVVLTGEACIDQSKMTGESIPVEVEKGSKVLAATVLVEGKIHLRCEATGVDTKAGMVLQTVSDAPLHETKIQNYASVMADKLVLPIFIGAGVTYAMTRNVIRLMSMLIFDFSTGIRIAAPTAVLSSMHRAGRRGILIKSGGALERLASVNAIVFDKTGTLTSGDPKVTNVISLCDIDKDELLAVAAAVEQRLHHPASRAIVKFALQKGLEIPHRDNSTHLRGMGIKARINHMSVIVGSKKLMESERISTVNAHPTEMISTTAGESIVYIAIDGKLAGVITYNDPLRIESTSALKKLRRMGIRKMVMATGDSEATANRVAKSCGITEVLARSFPEQKADLVQRLKAEGYVVAVIGDGINDSPAFVHADVAVSLHGGTEAARESADVVLTDDDLNRLPEAIEIARGAMNLVRQNLTLAVIPNSLGLTFAAMGVIGPAGATLLNNGSAIAAAVNSLRPLFLSDWSVDANSALEPRQSVALPDVSR
ncbi:MAG: heavy metal translocating P-type ATPase [Candidatus Obscuribacterales bacterium]